MKLVLVFFLLMPPLLFAAKSNEPSLSMRTYKRLSTVENLMKDKQMDQAGEKLEGMLESMPKNKVDRAYIYNSAGMYYLQIENYNKAKKLLTNAYNEQSLSEEQMLQLTELIANLHMHSEEFQKAVEYYERYLAAKPLAEKRIVMACAVAYYHLDKFTKVVSLIEKEKERFKPDENLYRMLFASYYELKQTRNALRTVSEMIIHWDKKREYWMQQSALYYDIGNTNKALESIELAYNHGLLEKESDYMQYIYLLLDKDIPYKAGELLEKFMQEKKVQKSDRNVKLLEQCQIHAREKDYI